MLKKNLKKPYLIFLVVLILLIFLHLTSILKPLERGFLKLVSPIGTKLYFWGNNINASYESKQEKDELMHSLSELEAKVAKLTIDKAKYQELLSENEKLREQLNFNKRTDFTTVLANVLAKEGIFNEGDKRDLIIDKGLSDGLSLGLAVLSEEGVVVGKITALEESSARVCLSTSPGCQLAVALQNENHTQGLSDGRLGLTIEMNYIPQLEKVSPGDLVISSGLSPEIPRGLVVGRVQEVKSESNEVFQSAIIEPVLNFNTLTFVSVVIP